MRPDWMTGAQRRSDADGPWSVSGRASANACAGCDPFVCAPPPPPKPQPKPVPKIVRLDSMSLFDSGKSALKAGSTKMLVNSLVGIKAKPGWLIVVAGHTDNR